VETGGSGGGGGGGSDILGPVTGFTSQAEVGTRYASDPDRLVHMTVGFVPICPTPEPVTYLISPDNGATWIWIGSQEMKSVGQVLKVDRLAPGETETWKVACVAGNLGGDPSPILDADLDALYLGIVRSAGFTVLGLSVPAGTTGITATIGSCMNVLSADGFTQYGVIPAISYTDPSVLTTAFFVRITVQIYNASGVALADEQPYGGTQITGLGDLHVEHALEITYVPGLAFVRWRFYLANRNSQGGGDFSDPATNTLQMVSYNGGALANHYDVPVTIPPFASGPGTSFNVTSVGASEVGPKYQDTNQGLHTTIGVTVVLDIDYSSPRTVTLWFDFGNGVKVWQGWYSLTFAGQVLRIGDSTLGSDGTRLSGDIWVPANATQGNWKVWCAAGHIDNGVDPSAYANFAFTVTPVAACLPNGTTGAQFLNAPLTTDPITYSKFDPGVWYWGYYCLQFTPPTILADPNYWFTMVTIQKGATIGGVWTPAPDSEGINESPTLSFLGRVHVEVNQLPGVSGGAITTIQKFGPKPANWVIPVPQNTDLTTNPYKDFRFWIYNVSRLGTDTSGSGGAGTYTLQTSCWPGGADHATLTPAPQQASLDIRAANPATIVAPLTGGNGQPLTVPPFDSGTGTGGFGPAYIADQAIHSNHMHAAAITVANDALAAGSVVDPKIVTVGINKVTYGTSVFAGDVVLTRGPNQAVIYLKNATSGPDPAQNPSGIYLFGQGDSSTGTSGLTSHPYAVFQPAGLSLFSGGSGPQILLTASGLTMWTVAGTVTSPYFTVNGTALSFVNGVNSVTINSNAMAFVDTGFNNRMDMSSVGISISNGSNRMVITSTDLQLQLGGVARVTINSTTGITISNGGTSSIVVSASAVSIVNGTLNYSSGGTTVNIAPSISTFIGTVNGIAIASSTSEITLTTSAIIIAGTAGTLGNFASMATGGFNVQTATNAAFLTPTSLQITGLPSTSPGTGTKQLYYDPATGIVHFAA
jgi:hypothetical protein